MRVGWYLTYNLSLRDLEEMMADRGLRVDHSTRRRWAVHVSPRPLECFHQRKRSVGLSYPLRIRPAMISGPRPRPPKSTRSPLRSYQVSTCQKPMAQCLKSTRVDTIQHRVCSMTASTTMTIRFGPM